MKAGEDTFAKAWILYMKNRRYRRAGRVGAVATVLVALLLVVPSARAQFGGQPMTAIENLRIEIGDGEVIESGTIVLRGDTIARVGADLEVPDRVTKIDGSGLVARL